jgi:kynurenine formamidase
MLAKRGKRFSLSLPLDVPSPPLFGREGYRHRVVTMGSNVFDDRLDGFSPQGSSQWDAFSHYGHSELGFYGGRDAGAVRQGALGVDTMARRGIVGRGVLLDVARFSAACGRPVDPESGVAFDAGLLAATAEWAKVELRLGDILCVRTGWLAWYLQLPASERAQLAGHGDADGTGRPQRRLSAPGLQASDEVAEYLWDHGIVAVVSDNPAVEAPRRDEQGVRLPANHDLTLHTRLIAMLGIAFGELFNVEELATDCANDGGYEFLFVAAPLHVPGGFGSPANALALK